MLTLHSRGEFESWGVGASSGKGRTVREDKHSHEASHHSKERSGLETEGEGQYHLNTFATSVSIASEPFRRDRFVTHHESLVKSLCL